MKLLINETLIANVPLTPEDSETRADQQERLEELRQLCKQMCVAATFDESPDQVVMTVAVQKVTLDEFAINHLFAEFLGVFFDIKLEYAGLGGAGCDFALRLTPAAPEPTDDP